MKDDPYGKTNILIYSLTFDLPKKWPNFNREEGGVVVHETKNCSYLYDGLGEMYNLVYRLSLNSEKNNTSGTKYDDFFDEVIYLKWLKSNYLCSKVMDSSYYVFDKKRSIMNFKFFGEI